MDFIVNCFYFTQAVRRMKTSPLTAEELGCIQEVIPFKSFSLYMYIDINLFFMHVYIHSHRNIFLYFYVQIFMCISSINLKNKILMKFIDL